MTFWHDFDMGLGIVCVAGVIGGGGECVNKSIFLDKARKKSWYIARALNLSCVALFE